MSGNPDPSGLDGVPAEASDPARTPFDYIIVGSGAGGAPLAARLAEAGKRVLVLEAGVDPGADPALQSSPEELTAAENERAIFHCPGFQAAASEPERYSTTPEGDRMSWHFAAQHLSDELQRGDPKAEAYDGRKVFYPRCSSVGGCTSHNTMVTICGNDFDWQRIADLTGDPSWNPSRMRYYFKRLERAHYTHFRFTWIGKVIDQVLRWLNPGRDAESSHGMSGWLDITTSNPKTAIGDKQLIAMVGSAVEIEDLTTPGRAWRLIKRIFSGQIYQDLDPNDQRTIRNSPEGLALIPLASGFGRRSGPRDFLLRTRLYAKAARFGTADLTIATGVFVRRIIFEKRSRAPRAVGVEYIAGRRLYQASRPASDGRGGDREHCFVRPGGEVILCGGAFNTPQLLMLSGIGNSAHLDAIGIAGPRDNAGNAVTDSVVDLPGVGENLRDRYEISVIARMKSDFETLEGVTFNPDESNDRARTEWNNPKQGPDRERTGLYATSGASLAVFKKSAQTDRPDDPPDLFLFGVPAAFRGYFPGWSKQVLKERPNYRGDPEGASEPDSHRLWTWIILKAYSRNKGTVRLRSADPLDQPEINFNYFDEKNDPDGSRADLEALVEAVAYARRLNGAIEDRIVAEVEPAEYDPERLRHWIKTRTWGHHACGTCRLGKDPWRSSTGDLVDKEAVIDSKFRVHGVEALRIVDASIFHEIPGYFIVTPTYMISEKAADTLLEAEARYPARLECGEATAVRKRRKRAMKAESPDESDPEKLPAETVGLALSGGGIRSATFCLGILQGFARRDRIREIDFLSTTSGGGYIGSFLGRLFTRKEVKEAIDPVGRVQDIVKNNASVPLQWLRSTANYSHGTGSEDARTIYAILLRNLFTIYFVLTLAGISAFGVMRLTADWIGCWVPATIHPPFVETGSKWAQIISPWWWLPLAALLLGVLPGALSFWLSPKPGTTGLLSFYPAVGWAGLLVGLALMTALPGGFLPAVAGGVVLIVALIVTERSRPRWPKEGEDIPDVASAMRNKLTLWLGGFLTLFAVTVVWFLLDSAGRACASGILLGILSAILATVMPFLPTVRLLVGNISEGSEGGIPRSRNLIAALIAYPLAAVVLVTLNAIVHTLFGLSLGWGCLTTVMAVFLSLIFGRGIDFVNASSLQSVYGARLARIFLGASNPERIYGTPDAQTEDVRLTQPGDDLAFHDYHPEDSGGPLHLISVCINETVDAASERDIPDRKGLPMSIGPCGLSAGRYHGIWTRPESPLPWKVWFHNLLEGAHPDQNAKTAIEGICVPGREFHALRAKDNRPVPLEPLSLRTWIAISGSDFPTGLGMKLSKPLALLSSLANVRLGYWWDTRLEAGDRPGRFRESFLRRFRRFPAWVARMQSLLLSEFRARFPGPGHRYWYLSDGGHFDVAGVYELFRRRLPLIIAVSIDDGGLNNLEAVVRQVRNDFGATLCFVAPEGEAGSIRFPDEVPKLVQDWFDPSAFGRLEQTGHGREKRAVLARVTYEGSGMESDAPEESWLVILRPTVIGDEPPDIVNYQRNHDSFPQETNYDQSFDKAKWESYRILGEVTALETVKNPRGIPDSLRAQS
jgi:choline dehydrogenase-like flavoprotein